LNDALASFPLTTIYLHIICRLHCQLLCVEYAVRSVSRVVMQYTLSLMHLTSIFLFVNG
jgi:hypothetical protein